MFNKNIKEKFLEHAKIESMERNRERIKDKERLKEAVKNSINSYITLFNTSSIVEEKFGKDIFDFNESEIDYFFEYKKPKTKPSARTIGRLLLKYSSWAIENGYSIYKDENQNPFNRPTEFFSKYVKDQSSNYLSVDEVKEIIDRLVNNQDAVLVALLFNGVQGKAVSEIRNLTIDDVDQFKKTITVKNEKGEERVVDLKDDCLDTLKLIQKAYLKEDYIKKNGEMEYHPNVKDVILLPSPYETKYVIKSRKFNKKDNSEKVNKYVIYNRIDMLKNLDDFQDIKDNLTADNIVKSGMIYEAKKIMDKEGGILNGEKIKRICKKFNKNDVWAVRDYINIETISKVYNTFDVYSVESTHKALRIMH